MAGDEPVELVFLGRIEAAMAFGYLLAQEPIGGNDLGPAEAGLVAVIEDQHVVAELVEGIAVAPRYQRAHVGDRRHLLVEDAIAQALRALDLLGGTGEANLEVAEAAQRAGSLVETPPISPHSFGKTLRHEG